MRRFFRTGRRALVSSWLAVALAGCSLGGDATGDGPLGLVGADFGERCTDSTQCASGACLARSGGALC